MKIKNVLAAAPSYFCNKIKKQWRDTERLILMATVCGGAFGLWTYYNDVENRRKETTIQYLVGFADMIENTDANLLDTINFFGNKSYERLTKDTLLIILQENKIYRQQIDNLLNYLNQLSIGCKYGFYDEHTAWYSNFGRIINATNSLEPYIDIKAKEGNYTGNNRPCIFLTDMVECWKYNLGKCEKWAKNDEKQSTMQYYEIKEMREKKEKKK